MSWLDGVRHRLRTVFGGAHERELEEEMQHHLELDALQRGDARSARRRFGNTTWYREEVRRLTLLGWLDVLRQDTTYVWRSIARSPGFTAIVVLTFALGLGVNGATFSVLDRIYFRQPTGVRSPDRVQRLWFELANASAPNGAPTVSSSTAYPTYQALRAASSEPGSVALYAEDRAIYVGQGQERVRARAVFASASYFDVLGVRPTMGRLYAASEDSVGNGAMVVVIGHRFWQRALGGAAVLGRPLRIEGEVYTVTGVLPPEFTGLELQGYDLWIPVASIPQRHWIRSRARWWESPTVSAFQVIQRADVPDAAAALERAIVSARESHRRLLPNNPDTLLRVLTGPLTGTGPVELGQDMKIALRLGGVSAIVLLIACANVMNLLLARAVSRRREVAVRLALGVSRARLMRQLVTETLILAILAGAASLVVAWWAGSILRSHIFHSVEFHDAALHWRVVLFAIATAVAAGLGAGIIPALQASRARLTHELKETVRDGAARRSRLRDGLVIAQAALSVVLLVGAALFVTSLRNVERLDIAYDADRLVFGYVRFEPGNDLPRPVVTAAIEQTAERLRSRPGIEAVARAQHVPMQGISFTDFWWSSDSSRSIVQHSPSFSAVSPEFFRTAGLRMLAGTPFDDAAGAREVVVNQRMAQLLWPAGNAMGQCVRFERADNPCFTVAGVVENSRQSRVIEEAAAPQFFVPLDNSPVEGVTGTAVIVRARPGESTIAMKEIRTALAAAFPSAEVSVNTMSELLAGEYWPWRLGARLFTGFGLLALLVAVIGIYSTMSFAVSQRTHEFGIRTAIGARASIIIRQVLNEGLRVVTIGVVIGIAFALAGGRLVAAMLYDVTPYDPVAMSLVGSALLVSAALAAMVPAWRATRIDPLLALRSE